MAVGVTVSKVDRGQRLERSGHCEQKKLHHFTTFSTSLMHFYSKVRSIWASQPHRTSHVRSLRVSSRDVLEMMPFIFRIFISAVDVCLVNTFLHGRPCLIVYSVEILAVCSLVGQRSSEIRFGISTQQFEIHECDVQVHRLFCCFLT